MGVSIGVDLGTTNSVVTAFVDGDVIPIENAAGTRTMPSMVTFNEDGSHAVGHKAKALQVTAPQRSIYSIKRFMGRRHAEVAAEEKLVPYEVFGKQNELVKVRMGKRTITPQEVSAMILEELKRLAEGTLGQPVTESVITVPAYFNDAQRQATKEAAEIAGMNARRIINEPTAAALAYGLEQAKGTRKAIIVDFGGGTLDLSAMSIGHGHFDVLAVHGNTHLGGDDFDQRIIDVVANDFFRREQIDLRNEPMALQRLKDAAQKAKAELSTAESTEIILPYVAVTGAGAAHLQYTLTRQTFEGVCADLFDSLRSCCNELREMSNLSKKSDTEIILVGGTTRMPAVRRIVSEAFETDRLNKSVNPDEVVAVGAGSLAAVLSGNLKNVHLMDVTSQTLGVESAGGGVSILVPRNTPIPTTISQTYSTPTDNQTSVPINVLEGDCPAAADNRSLGLFRLKGIKRAKAGVPQIKVAFAIDADGILSVSATDAVTGKSQEIVIQGGSGLDESDQDRLREEGKVRRIETDQKHEAADLRSHAEGVVINLTKWLEHNQGYIDKSAQKDLGSRIRQVTDALQKNRDDRLPKLLKGLDEAMTRHKAAS